MRCLEGYLKLVGGDEGGEGGEEAKKERKNRDDRRVEIKREREKYSELGW